MSFNKSGKWLIALALVCLMSAPLVAVEGAGSYRGSGVILPVLDNAGGNWTFYRFIHGYSSAEQSRRMGTPTDPVGLHITYLCKNNALDRCVESNETIPVTENDYILLDTINGFRIITQFGEQRVAQAPTNCQGWATAWMTESDQSDDKIADNALAADLFVFNLGEGWAWGVNGVSYRASENENCQPSDPADDSCVDDWMTDNSNNTGPRGTQFATLGFNGFESSDNEASLQYERTRFAENFFATLISPRINVIGSTGTAYYILPLSYMLEDADANNLQRTILVSEELNVGPYSSRYEFDPTLFNAEEFDRSQPTREVFCWACLSTDDLFDGIDLNFLNVPGDERHQGWLRIEGGGFDELRSFDGIDYEYWNRAIVVQVDNLNGGGNRSLGFYPAHDRTTAEIDADPYSYTASGIEGSPTDPDLVAVW